MNIILISKALLTRLINNAVSLNQDSFVRDVIQHNLKRLNIYGYEVSGFTSVFDSLQSYYDISMSLLDPANCQELFTRERRFTPRCATICRQFTALALQSKTHWCRWVQHRRRSGKLHPIPWRSNWQGRCVRNSIIMQGTYISEGVHLDCVIADKSVVVRPHKTVTGTSTYPVYIGKGIVI